MPTGDGKSKTAKNKYRGGSADALKVRPAPDDEEEVAAGPPPMSKSKCKARTKTGSATKVKRPKSRPKLAVKERMPAKASVDEQAREQVMAVLEAVYPNSSKTKAKAKERRGSNERIAKTNKAHPTKGKAAKVKSAGKNLPEVKSKRPKSRPKSRGLACKSSKVNTGGPKTSMSSLSLGQTSQSKQLAASNTTQIFIFGSQDNPQALELLQSLVAKMKTQPNQEGAPERAVSDETSANEMVTNQTALEELYDAVFELTNNIRTIQDSYEKIINSLMNLQKRRGKGGHAGKASLFPASATTGQSTVPSPKTSTTTNNSIARFMDPVTRDDAFSELFAQVETIRSEMASFLTCFDDGGFFDSAKYANQQISVRQRQTWLDQVRSLAPVVDALLAEYNREVLDMFRLDSGMGN